MRKRDSGQQVGVFIAPEGYGFAAVRIADNPSCGTAGFLHVRIFGDLSVPEDQNPAAVFPHIRQIVGGEKYGDDLAAQVQSAGGFIQDKDPAMFQKRLDDGIFLSVSETEVTELIFLCSVQSNRRVLLPFPMDIR